MSAKIVTFLSDERSEYVVNDTQVSDEVRAVYTAFRDGALSAYCERTPYAMEACQLLKDDGAVVMNDHVALRSFKGGKKAIEGLFLAFGYRKEDNILIDALHLDCHWYEPPESTNWPKVFISEQQIERLPEEAQAIVNKAVGSYYADDPLSKLGLDNPSTVNVQALISFLETPPWNISSVDYDRLLAMAESDASQRKALMFTAWTLIHGHRWNHLTLLQNRLAHPRCGTLEELNDYLKEKGLPFNTSEKGEVQGSSEVHLKQSSTIANMVEHTFTDGVKRSVPGSFVEFIERFKVDGVPFRGFLAANAQGIFSSTDAKR